MASISPQHWLLLLLLLPGQAGGTELPTQLKIFQRLLDQLSAGEDSLAPSAVSSFLNNLQNRVQCAAVPCGKCIGAQQLFHLLGRNSTNSSHLTVRDFFAVTPGLVSYLSDPVRTCALVQKDQWAEGASDFLGRFTGENISQPIQETLEELLRQIQQTYQPANESHEPCTNVHQIAEDADLDPFNITEEGMRQVFGVIIYHVLEGQCFRHLPSAEYFLGFIFQKFSNDSKNMTLEELGIIMETLKLGGTEKHEEHGETHDES
ncbi:zinc transporter ZIP4, partial [Rhinatrema bivittatum]|uniref:zinc transporter ZIP4 n=1 Tax=Rhinatrema bivittatum TaxID=194408 RepID=UPI001126CE28